MTRLSAAIALASFGGLLAPLSAGAQVTRSDEIGRPPDKVEEVTVGRYVFAGIGIDDYHTPAIWKSLDNAVNDVEQVRTTLREGFDFESPEEWVLTNGEATRPAIMALVDDLRRNLQADDNLIFFYAGHGAEVADVVGGEEVGRTGYLVPVGVKEPVGVAPSQYVEIEDLLEAIARLPARHVLVILDSCYSGMALDGSFKTRGGGETQQAADLIRRVSRRVLTSAQSDQLAADGGADFPENSLFTGWLTEGLRRAAMGSEDAPSPDTDSDGMITVTELYAFVRGRVGTASESRQTPDFGAFELDQRGELVLALESDPFDDLYAEAHEAFEEGKFDAFFAASEAALDVQAEGPRSSYLRYLSARIDDDLELALTSLRALAAFAEAGEVVPLSAGELMIELRRTERQCQKAGCQAAPGD